MRRHAWKMKTRGRTPAELIVWQCRHCQQYKNKTGSKVVYFWGLFDPRQRKPAACIDR